MAAIVVKYGNGFLDGKMKYHLIGAGGVGMSALATLVLKLGHVVTGSDRTLGTDNLKRLERLGARIFPDDGSGVAPDVDAVIVSTAIEDSNRDLVRARELGLKVVHRAAALQHFLSGRRLVAVAGTCGKSSVTALLGHVLSSCGLDPLCVNGANVVGWEGAVRFGAGEYAVAEVDESDKSLSAFSPYAAIVTNSSADHFSKDEMDEVFDAFIAKATGPVLDARGETYLPEDYMAQNESLAVRMAVMLGCDESASRASLASFKGVERRLQPCGAAVYDDYAHNPEKLRSMIAVLKKRHRGAICVIWRPHGYGPLKKMLDGLAAMFSEALSTDDALLVLPVYDAGGTADRTIGSEALVGRVSGPEAVKADSFDDVAAWCGENARRFAAVAVAGARDPGLPALARRIAADRLGEGAAR